jgi:hypothetical protein
MIMDGKAAVIGQSGFLTELGQENSRHHAHRHRQEGGEPGHGQGADDGIGHATARNPRRIGETSEKIKIEGAHPPAQDAPKNPGQGQET